MGPGEELPYRDMGAGQGTSLRPKGVGLLMILVELCFWNKDDAAGVERKAWGMLKSMYR
jgi:hypothetical protein